MVTSLSKLVDKLTDNINNDKCIKCKSNLCFVRAINEKLIFKCIDCEKEYEKEFNKELIERFTNTYKFCDNDLDKFIMLLRKGVYPYEYIDEWDKFNEKVLPGKESFYSNLTLENISKFLIWVNTMTCSLEVIRCYLRIYSKVLDNLV